MTISKTTNGSELILVLDGRLDTTTAPQLEKEKDALPASLTSLVLDFTNLAYVSSAGLRILLGMQKVMSKQGKMVIKGSNETIKEVFEVTGFIDILTIL